MPVNTGIRRHVLSAKAYATLLRRGLRPLSLGECRPLKHAPGRPPFKGRRRVSACMLPQGVVLMVHPKHGRVAVK